MPISIVTFRQRYRFPLFINLMGPFSTSAGAFTLDSYQLSSQHCAIRQTALLDGPSGTSIARSTDISPFKGTNYVQPKIKIYLIHQLRASDFFCINFLLILWIFWTFL
jgi:hypothetical protein